MNRAGLLNFWYYDEETFDFSNGKLLLRGSNGSGKSVTMQSFLPVLLDGRKSPDRLDPFGSKARRMEDYLLGEKEIADRDERTGYLFIEYKREDTNQYLTTGIGLQAKRHKAMKFWGFVITDNRRIGEDFSLYKEEWNAGEKQKIPFSRIELENRIADGGSVVQSQKEYMNLVNKYVFGFETTEAYEDLIKLLIQLRSPKLSKDFKPTVIYEILEAALPPLSDEDLRHLSDTIEHMDQTKQQIEQLNRELEALKKLNQAYQTYNERQLADQAEEFVKADRKAKREQSAYEEQVQDQQKLAYEIKSLEKQKQGLDQQQDTFEQKEERLRSHKVWNLEQERQEVEQALKGMRQTWKERDDKLSHRRQRELNIKQEQDEAEETVREQLELIDDHILNLRNDAEESSFIDHDLNEQDYQRHRSGAFQFDMWKKQANQHFDKLGEIEKSLERYEYLKQQYESKNNDIADLQRNRDKAKHEEQDWSNLFEEDKQAKLNEIHAWVEANSHFVIDGEQLQQTARSILNLYEPTEYTEIQQPYRQSQFRFEQEQRKQLSKYEHDLDGVTQDIADKEAEVKEWKDKKDPEPDRHEQTKLSREQLVADGRAFLPLYEAVEFRPDIPDEVRPRIEAALLDAGLLDALIMNDNSSVDHDRVIEPSPHLMEHTLADYLVPDEETRRNIPVNLVEEVLQSIVIDDADATSSIGEDGSYHLGILRGHAVPVDHTRFIGRAARQRYRERKITSLEEELTKYYHQRQVIQTAITSINDNIKQSQQTIENFPKDIDLRESFRRIQEKRFEIKQFDEQLERLNAELRTIYDGFRSIKGTIENQTRHYNIETTRQAYQQAITVMNHYEKDLIELEGMHTTYLHHQDHIVRLENRLEELAQEVDELRGEVNEYEDHVKRKEMNLQEIVAQLEQQGAEDIRKQVEDVQKELVRIRSELVQINELLPAKRNQYDNNEDRRLQQQAKKDLWQQLRSTWEATFSQEWNHGFVELSNQSEVDILQLAKKVHKEYGYLLKEKDASQVAEQLTRMFYFVQTDLMEYRMKDYERTANTPEWMNEVEADDDLPHLQHWKLKARRRFVELDYFGKQVNPAYVQIELESEQVRQEGMLDQKDRELYEEILFKSVGNKLRSRIQRAEKWTEKMNKLMESRNSSSGLTFSIKWKPRTADSEEELDTKDLVSLLKRDARTLKTEDLDQIIHHFRSKIDKAKELIDDKGEGHTLLQVLKEVLDYRKWFSFVLSYRRTNEPKRELTNHAFYKFSGGEKAMAMYIPLFTACYSRYQEAEAHAPYIITLDEAFAGVDENNIREMFEIVEKLGFDYMMNSQVLWGDYDTISELSISELVRPQNADFVTVINYRWDGEKLDLTLPEDEAELENEPVEG